jgi:hypothetical protein
MPPEGPNSWPKADSRKQWLVFYRLDQMTFTGKGTIEGNGQEWWALPCKPHRVSLLCESFSVLIYLLFFILLLLLLLLLFCAETFEKSYNLTCY